METGVVSPFPLFLSDRVTLNSKCKMSSVYQQIDFDRNPQRQAPETLAVSASGEEKPSLFLLGVATLTLFFTTQIMQLVPALDGLPVAKVVVGLVVLLFVFSPHLLANRLRLRQIPQVKYLFGILAFAIVTVPFSFWRSGSLEFIIENFSKNVVFVYLLVQGAKDNRAVRLICGSLIFGCALIVLAILTGFGPETNVFAREDRIMVAGTYDVNDLALLFVVAIPFAFFMLKSSSRMGRILLFIALALLLVGMIKTASRGGFLGLLVISGLLLARSSREVRKYTLLTILGGAILFAVATPAAYWTRISTIFNLQRDYNLKEQTGRLQIWQTGLQMIATRPLTGVGINCFPTAYAAFLNTKFTISPHNSFVQIAAELGIPGLALFLAIMILSLRTARTVRRRARDGLLPDDLWWHASAVEVSWLGFIVSAAFLTHAYSPIFCFLTGISASLYARYKAADKPAESVAEAEIRYV